MHIFVIIINLNNIRPDLRKNFFEAVTERNFQTYQRKSKCRRKPVLLKLLTLFNYWSNQMEKLIGTVKIFLLTWLTYAMWLKMQYICKFMARLSLLIWKVSSRKNEVIELLLDVTHFVKSFISLVVTNGHFFLFAFIWNMALMCIPYEYFKRVYVEVFMS